jgi:hypothetical protein
VNQIRIAERKLPGEAEIVERLRDRLSVKIEQELRALPERERKWNLDRFLPVVDALAASAEGRRDLAAVCAAYLHEHRPETSVVPPLEPLATIAPAERAREESAAADDRPPQRRARRRRRR